jgi:hypothetical protein
MFILTVSMNRLLHLVLWGGRQLVDIQKIEHETSEIKEQLNNAYEYFILLFVL